MLLQFCPQCGINKGPPISNSNITSAYDSYISPDIKPHNFLKLQSLVSRPTRWRGATHPVGLLGGLVPRRQDHVAGAVAGGGAAGRGLGGGGGARAAGVLLGIVGVAAVQRLGAAPQERVAVSAAGSRGRALAAAALEAGAAPHGAGGRRALPG